jgi:hypothetical protein
MRLCGREGRGIGAAILRAERFRGLMSIKWSKRFAVAIMAGLVVCLLALSGVSAAQDLSGLSQLLGGGLGHARSPSESAATPVTVQRGAPPYTGTFTGRQATSSGTDNLRTEFACYPAHDPDFAQTKTFLCYAAQ